MSPPGEGRAYFATPHLLLLSRDNLLYVAGRSNRRIQVFSPDGKFIRQLTRYDAPFARNLAFSPDPEQTFIYTGYDKGIAVIGRKAMQNALRSQTRREWRRHRFCAAQLLHSAPGQLFLRNLKL